MCKKQLFILLQLVIIPCLSRSKKQESCAWHWGGEAAGERQPWGARGAHPLPMLFCFQITRINKLIISVLVVMRFSLLATSYNVLMTFIIFRDILCGTLRRGQQECTWSFIQLFIFLSVFSGFYGVGFFPSCNLSQCSFLTLSPCFLLLLVIFLFLSNTFHALFSSPCSACTHESRKVQEHFGFSYSCALLTTAKFFL